MQMTHVNEILEHTWDEDFSLALPLWVGAGCVDPGLVAPLDDQELQDVEDLIAFRTSGL